MRGLQQHFRDSADPIKVHIKRFIGDQADDQSLKWNFCVQWPVDVATDLACRIDQLNPRGTKHDPTDRLLASLAARYMFDLLANVSTMLNFEPEEERNRMQDQWIKLRDLLVFSDGTYRMPMRQLSPEASKRLQNKKGFKSSPWPKYNKKTGKTESIESIKVGNPAFLFEDPWGLTMAKKVGFIPISDQELFLERWKTYSHVAHASAFSLWPTWINPVPIHDATQTLGLLFSVVSRFIGCDFDSKLFMKKAWLLLEEDQESAKRGGKQ